MPNQQSTINNGNTSPPPVHLLYEEVKEADKGLETKCFSGNDAAAVTNLIERILSKTGGTHTIDELNLPGYAERWVDDLLGSSNANQVPQSKVQPAEDLAENFAENMKTSAKKKGKYILIISFDDKVVVCHSYTGNEALTTDMEVVEELLSGSNIDKFAEFKNQEGDLIVNHYEQRSTQSFTDWLGIPANETIYDTRGNVKVYTNIDGIRCTFVFDRADIVEKLIGSDKYSIHDGILRTPTHDGQVRQIAWGGKTYSDTEDFKQEIFTTHYELNLYRDKYTELVQSLDGYTSKTIIDRENKISIIDESEEEVFLEKKIGDINILYLGGPVEIESSWVTKMATQIMESQNPLPVCHMSNKISTAHTNIGNLKVYNEIGLENDEIENLDRIARAANDLGTSNMANLILYMVYHLLSKSANEKISKFFEKVRTEFRQRYESDLSDGTSLMMNESPQAGIEFKAREWFTSGGNQDIADDIADEFSKGSRVIIGGVEEGTQEINALTKGKFGSERMDDVARKTANINGYSAGDVHVWTIPIDDGRCLIGAANAVL